MAVMPNEQKYQGSSAVYSVDFRITTIHQTKQKLLYWSENRSALSI
jgi:hypothetical protein